jgi:hypothetical protein
MTFEDDDLTDFAAITSGPATIVAQKRLGDGAWRASHWKTREAAGIHYGVDTMIEQSKTQSLLKLTAWSNVAILGLLLAGVAPAQQAQISGRVMDLSGAPIRDVRVTVINNATGATRDTKTRSSTA